MLGRECSAPGELVIICDQPTEFDEKNGAFTGPIWRELDRVLLENNLSSDLWVYANPCRYVSTKKKKFTPSMGKHCYPALMAYLAAHGVKYALLVGDVALKIFTNGKDKALTKARGSIIEVEGITAMPVYNYADVYRDHDLHDTFIADLQHFKRVITGTTVEPSYCEEGALPPGAFTLLNGRLGTAEASCVAYDLETEGLDCKRGRVKMVGLAWRTGEGYRTCVIHPEETPFPIDDFYKWTWEQIAHLFKAFKRTVAHNSKFDDGWLQNRGVPVHVNFDSMLASYLENELTPHTLKFLAKKELSAPAYEEGIDHDDTSVEMMHRMARYCQLDCYYALRLRETYLERKLRFPHVILDYQQPLAKLLMPGTRVLEKVEARGVHVSPEALVAAQDELVKNKRKAEAELAELLPTGVAGVNYDSPAQLRKLLYGKKAEGGFGYKPIYIDRYVDPDEDDPTTGKAALKKLARQGSTFAAKLLEYRGYAKGLSSFVEPWLEMLANTTHSSVYGNRLYPQYNLGRTATGRLSANNPNLQQVSRDKLIRNLISATPGYSFVEADFSQVELRVAAWLGRIESMAKIYRAGGDIHINTAKSIARLASKEWDTLSKIEQKEYRQRSKAVNFGFIYEMSHTGFQDYADASYDVVLTENEAKEYKRVYFGLYPELSSWHDRVKAQAKRDKYVLTPTGRMRHLPNVDSVDKYLANKALRCAINTPVQSFASDLTLLAMIDLEVEFEKYPETARIIGQCHDAIFFEVKEGHEDEVCKTIQHTMTHPRLHEFGVYMDIPLEVEIKIGKSWGDADCRIFGE